MMLTLNDGRSELWQWDTKRKLTVDAECSQVHFSNKVFGRSIDVDVVDGAAEIPDILLQTDRDLTAWAFVGTAENGYTKISKVFKVNRRNKPADYVFTPTEQTTLEEIKERLDDLEAIQDPDAIKNAVDDYLANNPVQVDEKDPTVPEWAKQPNPPYVKIPDKLPNPHAINFTGAVNASYDGSRAVEIKIPDSGGNVDLTGVVKSVNGVTPDENGNVEIAVSGSSGSLNATASALLINILKNVSFYNADQTANITALEAALAMGGSSGGGGTDEPDTPVDPDEPVVTTYSIVSALLYATSNNAAASVEEGASYTATITADDGYTLEGATVSVSMGGVDITATAYANGVVNIGSVTGNVIITVNAVSIAVSETLYELAEPTVFDGTNSIDTGVALLANDISWTIVGEVENLADNLKLTIFRLEEQPYNNYRFNLYASNEISMRWSDKVVACANLVWLSQKAGNTTKFVITHEAGASTIKYSGYGTNITGKTERYDAELVRDNYVALDGSLRIGIEGNIRVDAFGIYSRVYTADEITAYLGA